jgi:hypothetical protein
MVLSALLFFYGALFSPVWAYLSPEAQTTEH